MCVCVLVYIRICVSFVSTNNTLNTEFCLYLKGNSVRSNVTKTERRPPLKYNSLTVRSSPIKYVKRKKKRCMSVVDEYY